MKAIVFEQYGTPDVLQLREIDIPTPTDNEVRIRVLATSVNDWDAGIISGTPLMMRMWYGFRKPKMQFRIIGCDVAGIVDAVGSHVSRFKVGDAVYGDLHASGFGAYAEYSCAKEDHLAKKPDALSFEEAAATPHSATLAWQALHNSIKPGGHQKILINGAGGGVGPIAIKLLKQNNVEVTGVDSAGKLDMMQSIGFDHVIDYEREDFTRSGEKYDLIFDTKTCHYPFRYLSALSPAGSYITIGGSTAKVFAVLLLSWLIKRMWGKRFILIGLKPAEGLEEMAPLFEDGTLKPVVDGPFALSQASDAMRYYLSGKQRGRVVIKVNQD